MGGDEVGKVGGATEIAWRGKGDGPSIVLGFVQLFRNTSVPLNVKFPEHLLYSADQSPVELLE